MSEFLRLKQVYDVLPEEVRASQSDSRTFRLPPVGGCIISQSPSLDVSRQHTGPTKTKWPSLHWASLQTSVSVTDDKMPQLAQ